MINNLISAVATMVDLLVKYVIWCYTDTSTQHVMALLIGLYLLACLEHWHNNLFFLY